jgi:hypothetical protein
MSDASRPLSRPDLDAARASIRVEGPPPVSTAPDQDHPEGTFWDKDAPTRAPGDKGIAVPGHLGELAAFFQEIVLSEAFLLELCFDRTLDMVTDGVNRRLVGTDHDPSGGSPGGPFTAAHYAGIAAPMTVELYKNVLLNIGGQEVKYNEIVKRAAEKREELVQEKIRALQKSPIGKGGIIVPGSF